MKILALAVAICCLSVAQSTYESGHDIQLHSVPDLSSYSKTIYPQQTIHELGEISSGVHEPEVIKVTKTVEVKVPVPFPIKVPHKVPYPVAYKVPQIVKVPHIVKISHPVPVEVVKHVPVQSHGGDDGGSYGIQQQGYGGGGGGFSSGGGDYGGGSLGHASALGGGSYGGSYGSLGGSLGGSIGGSIGGSLGGGHQNDWQGIPSASYGVTYNGPQSDFGGSAHGSEQSSSLTQEGQYSTIGQDAYSNQGAGGQEGEGGDYSAQASSNNVQQDQNGNYGGAQSYQTQESQSH